jgi:hypothetical protein
VKTAQILARAGLHLGPTTVRRMQRDTRWPEPRKVLQPIPRIVTARHPNNLWHVDLTTVPISLGFWTSWLPFTLPQVWPFCWWVTTVKARESADDHDAHAPSDKKCGRSFEICSAEIGMVRLIQFTERFYLPKRRTRPIGIDGYSATIE